MAGFADLIKKLENIKSNAAIFRKVVLHAHSPHSYDYKSPTKSDKNSIESEFKDELKAINQDMVAITDHMKCDFACRLSLAARPIHICILPGMEINIRPLPPWHTFRLHVLAIFPERYSLEQVCKILPHEIPDERKRSGREEIKDVDLSKFIEKIHGYGGLCIAAHIDNERGVRRVFRQLGRDGIELCDPEGEFTEEEERQISEAFKEWIFSAGFDAIEVSKDMDKVHYRWISAVQGRKVSIPVLLSNDAHFVKDIGLQDRTNYIKMTDTCFEGLKQALQFPDTRIRFPSDVPIPPSPRILGIEMIAGDEKGFFKELRIAFSDNLTCLIGPRGSGKSAIIEALRYVFGYNRTLEQIEQPGADLAKKVRGLQEATLTNCVIRVVYCGADNEPHILESAYDLKRDYGTRVYTKEGEEREVHDVEASGLYPLRLFGWSEIETLGREAHRQRELLDRLIPGIFGKLEQRNELRFKLAEQRRKIDSQVTNLMTIMKKNRGEITRYKEYKADFDNLNTPEVKALFQDIDTAKAKEFILSKLKANAEEWLNTLADTMETDLFEGVNELLAGSTDSFKTWWSETKRQMKLAGRQSDIRNEIKKAVNDLKEIVNLLAINIQDIKQEIQKKEKAIREQVSEEAGKQIAAELRRSASERLQRVNQLRRNYNEEWKRFNGLLSEWKDIIKDLTDLHDEITGKRAKRKQEIESRLNQFGTEEMTISLRFIPGGDRNNFEDYLRDSGFLTRELHGNYKANQWPKKIAMGYTPIEVAETILTKKQPQFQKSNMLHNRVKLSVDEEIIERLIKTFFPFSYDDDADIPTFDYNRLMKILKVAEVEWDDFEGILLNNRPVENLSPGQRSSAMLPLIALAENTPLIIDQPEDNLDNRLVGKMLVDILADLKEKRQIIVATHNPNIVVLGDAEQIIVLDALSDSKGICTRIGSIDNKEIIESVVEIMEGGREAFLTRRRRYAFDLD